MFLHGVRVGRFCCSPPSLIDLVLSFLSQPNDLSRESPDTQMPDHVTCIEPVVGEMTTPDDDVISDDVDGDRRVTRTHSQEYMCREISSTTVHEEKEDTPPLGIMITQVVSLAGMTADDKPKAKATNEELTIVEKVIYECKLCHWMHTEYDDMVTHVSETHKRECIYSCPHCPFGCSIKLNMERHVHRTHNDDTPDPKFTLMDEEKHFEKKVFRVPANSKGAEIKNSSVDTVSVDATEDNTTVSMKSVPLDDEQTVSVCTDEPTVISIPASEVPSVITVTESESVQADVLIMQNKPEIVKSPGKNDDSPWHQPLEKFPGMGVLRNMVKKPPLKRKASVEYQLGQPKKMMISPEKGVTVKTSEAPPAPISASSIEDDQPQDLSTPRTQQRSQSLDSSQRLMPPPAHQKSSLLSSNSSYGSQSPVFAPRPAHQGSRERSPVSPLGVTEFGQRSSASPVRPFSSREPSPGPRMTSSPRVATPSHLTAAARLPSPLSRETSPMRFFDQGSVGLPPPAHGVPSTGRDGISPDTYKHRNQTSVVQYTSLKSYPHTAHKGLTQASSPVGSMAKEMPPLIRMPQSASKVGRLPPPLIPSSSVRTSVGPPIQPRLPLHHNIMSSQMSFMAQRAQRRTSIDPDEEEEEDLESYKQFNLLARLRGPGYNISRGYKPNPPVATGPAIDKWRQFQSNRFISAGPPNAIVAPPPYGMLPMNQLRMGEKRVRPMPPLIPGPQLGMHMLGRKPSATVTNTNPSSHQCPYCPFRGEDADTMHNHILTHAPHIHWTCPYCRVPSKMQKSLVEKHIRNAHPDCHVVYIPYGVPV